MAILETQNLTYKYSVGTPFEKVAIEDITFQLKKVNLSELSGIQAREKVRLYSISTDF